MESVKNPVENGAKSATPRIPRRRSLFSVLNDAAANRTYYQNNDTYEQLVKAEMSEWNKLTVEATSKCLKSNHSVKLDNTSIRSKIADITLDPEAFLAEQKEFIAEAEHFLKLHRAAQEKNQLITEITSCLVDDTVKRVVEEERYKKKTHPA